MTMQEFIQNENNLRIKLVEDVKFRELCIKACKELGISANEWNENKMAICLFLANEIIAKDNKENGELRNALS